MRPADITPSIRYLAGQLRLSPPREATSVPLCAEVVAVGVTRGQVRRGVEVRWVHSDELRHIADVTRLPSVIPARDVERPWASSDYHQLAREVRRADLHETHAKVADATASLLAQLANHHAAGEISATARTALRNNVLKSDLTLGGLSLREAATLLTELADAVDRTADSQQMAVRLQVHRVGSRSLSDLNAVANELLGTSHSALAQLLSDLLADPEPTAGP